MSDVIKDLCFEINVSKIEKTIKEQAIKKLTDDLQKMVDMKVKYKSRYMEARIGQIVGEYVRDNLTKKIHEIIDSTDIKPMVVKAIERSIQKNVEKMLNSESLTDGVLDG